MNNHSKAYGLTRIILKVIKENKPQSVEQLTKMLSRDLDLTEEEIVDSVLKLQAEGVIKLQNQSFQSRSIANYLKTGEAIWYWLTIAAGTITSILSFIISESAYQWVYARNFLGLVFILFLPGFAFIKALFPTNISHKTSMRSLEAIQRIALSIGMSIALVSIVGFLLHYSPWGLDMTTIVLSVFTLTLVFASAAVIREYQTKTATAKRQLLPNTRGH